MNTASLFRALPWALVALLALWLIGFQGAQDPQAPASAYVLPEDAPDVYITSLDLTRYNAQGQPTLTTTAKTMSVYEDRGQSLLELPVIHRLDDGTATWQIIADQATLFDNDDIDLSGNVVVTQQNAEPPMLLFSEQMQYTEATQRIVTDLPVQVQQGKQRITSIGLTVNLDTIEPIIQFLSDVDFYYDPS